MALVKCRSCGNDVSTEAVSCPKCGAPVKPRSGWLRTAVGCLGLVVLAVVVTCIVGANVLHMRERAAAATASAPAPGAPAATAPPARTTEEKVVHTSPRQLELAYQKNEVAADTQYKKRTVALLGVAEEIRKDAFGNIVVNLDTGEGLLHHLRCGFPADQEAAVAKLERRQLIGVRGRVLGYAVGSVSIEDCALIWAAQPTDSAKEQARFVGLSYIHCFAEMRPALRTPPAEFRKPDGGSLSKAELPQFEKLQKVINDAEHALAGKGLPCDHPLIVGMEMCDGADDRGPECRSSMVKAVLAAMPRG